MRGLGAVEVDIVVVAMVLWLVCACKKSSGVYGCLFVGEVVCGVLVESGFIFFCEGGLHVAMCVWCCLYVG